MKRTKAEQVTADIEKLCEKHGLYYETTKRCKPCLKNIAISINVKVDETDSPRKR